MFVKHNPFKVDIFISVSPSLALRQVNQNSMLCLNLGLSVPMSLQLSLHSMGGVQMGRIRTLVDPVFIDWDPIWNLCVVSESNINFKKSISGSESGSKNKMWSALV